MRFRLCAASGALITIVIAGCGSSSTSSGGSPAPVPTNPGGGPVAAQHDPCKLFSTDQLSAAFGLNFAAGRAEEGSLQPTCDWYDNDAGTSVVAAVKKADEPNFDSDLSGPVSDQYDRTSPVVGADSVWFDPDSTDSVSMIVIAGGYQYQMSVGVTASADKDQRRTQLQTLAAGVF